MKDSSSSQACESQFSSQTRLRCGAHSGGVQPIPVKPFKSGRRRFIKVRVNEIEYSRLTKRGKSEGGISALVRNHLLGEGIKDARREAIRELARLARNFNTLAIEVNRYDAPRAVEVLLWLVAIERELTRAIDALTTKGSP